MTCFGIRGGQGGSGWDAHHRTGRGTRHVEPGRPWKGWSSDGSRARPTADSRSSRTRAPPGGSSSTISSSSTTPPRNGTHVELKIVGRGSLQGTTVDSSGALHLLFSKTNSFSKIVSNVHGGTGQADLASIFSADLFNNNAASSLSGIGASVIKMINLGDFNLIAGGTIDVTSGIDNLNLNSVGPEHADPASRAPVHRHGRPDHQHHRRRASRTRSSPMRSWCSRWPGINGEFLSAGNIVNVTDPTQPGPAAGASGHRPEDQPHQRQCRLGAEPVDRQQDLRLRRDDGAGDPLQPHAGDQPGNGPARS